LLPDIDEDDYKLLIDGLVDDKRPWTLDRLYALPQKTQITRLVCVEGWSAIGKWIAAHCAASREADASPPLILFHALPV
jgi:DMSO/TMAO reductase YedYZ molybdopterin-dependent catalytic subunit